MRGSEHLKAILKYNNDTKRAIVKSCAIFYLLVAALYFYLRASPSLFVVLLLPSLATLLLLHRASAPVFTSENGAQRLVSVSSLSSPGIIAFYFDVLFWSMLCQILILFSWKWAFLYLGILVSFVSEFLYKPYKKIKSL